MLTPDEATAALQEASRIRDRGRRVVQGQATRLPMVWWGLSWIVSYSAAQFLPFALAAIAASAMGVAAFGLSRLGERWDPTPGRTGWERQFMRSWWAVLVVGFAIDFIAAPAPIQVFLLIPGAVWGLAMLLYAVSVGDIVFGVLGAGIVAAAAVLRVYLLDDSLFLFGLIGGGAMAATGLARLVGPIGGR